MATPDVIQGYEDSNYHSIVEIKVPTTLKPPIEDWPQEVTDILSPDLLIGRTDSSTQQLGHENDAVGTITSSAPMVSSDLITRQTDSSVRQLGLENDGAVSTTTSSTPIVVPSTKTSTDLAATTEAAPDNAPEDSLSSTTEDDLLATPDTSPHSTPNMLSPKTQAALASTNDSTVSEKPVEKVALRILDIIQRYGHSTGVGPGVEWAGKNKFLPLVEQSIEKNEAVKMVLPAFPCVSVFNSFSFRPFL